MGNSVEKSELETIKMLSCKLRAMLFWEKEKECKMLGKSLRNFKTAVMHSIISQGKGIFFTRNWLPVETISHSVTPT